VRYYTFAGPKMTKLLDESYAFYPQLKDRTLNLIEKVGSVTLLDGVIVIEPKLGTLFKDASVLAYELSRVTKKITRTNYKSVEITMIRKR